MPPAQIPAGYQAKALLFVLTLFLILLQATVAGADIIPVEEVETSQRPVQEKKSQAVFGLRVEPTVASNQNPWPGKMIGPEADQLRKWFYQNWSQRSSSYEILIQDKTLLAKLICGLAYFSGDLSRDIPLTKCVKGIQGFHYGVGMVRDWARAVKNGEFPCRNLQEEEMLISWLVAGGVLIETDSGIQAGADIKHLIGASEGKRRPLSLNLNHERLHVLWDEDALFREKLIKIWQSDPSIQEVFLDEHPAYAAMPELQQIEEWAVRLNESKPVR